MSSFRRTATAPYIPSAQPLPRRDERPGLYPETVPVLETPPEALDGLRRGMENAVSQIAEADLLDEHTAPLLEALTRTGFERLDAQLTERFRRAERYVAAEERHCVSYRAGLEQDLERIAGRRRAAELVQRAEEAAQRADRTNRANAEDGGAQ